MPKDNADAAAMQARGETISVDLCVIGAGSGGLSVAAAAAAFGQRVVLIEKHKMGGDCLNYGCVPSKALIAAANRAHAMRTSRKFGIAPVEPNIDARAVHDHVKGVIAAIAPNDSVERFTGMGVRPANIASPRAASSSPPGRRPMCRRYRVSQMCRISPTKRFSTTPRACRI